jgi:hypothetical protein
MFTTITKAHHATKAKAEKLAEMLEAEYPALAIVPVAEEHDEAKLAGFNWTHRDAPDAEPTKIGHSRKAPELADLIAACEDLDLDPEAIETEEPRIGGSVVDPMYRTQYREASSTGQSCGDFLAEWLTRCLNADGKLDQWAFTAVLSHNGVDLTAKWARVANSQTPGWIGRYRMNGRQQLEKVVALTGKLYDEAGNEHEVDAEWLASQRTKHGKWIAKQEKAQALAESLAS